MIVGLFDPITDPIEDIATSIWDGVTKVPGVEFLVEQVGDFANTALGKTVLTALASSLYGTLAWTAAGPQLATIAWTVPGLLRGDSFTEAWLSAFKERVKKTGEIVGADVGMLIGQQVTEVLGKLGEMFPPGELPWSVQQIAEAFGVREDAAALARDLFNRGTVAVDTAIVGRPSESFDWATGKMRAAFTEIDAYYAKPAVRLALRAAQPKAIGLRLRAAAAAPVASPSVAEFVPTADELFFSAQAMAESKASSVWPYALAAGAVLVAGAGAWWYAQRR